MVNYFSEKINEPFSENAFNMLEYINDIHCVLRLIYVNKDIQYRVCQNNERRQQSEGKYRMDPFEMLCT